MLALKSDVGKLDSASGLIATPWTKLCFKGQDGKARQVCFTGKNAHVGSGPTVLAVVAIDPEGEPKKLLRVTLPLGVDIASGVFVSVDSNAPMQTPYVICLATGCLADFALTPELLVKLKNGQNLVVQALNSNGALLRLPLPLQDIAGANFAKAYDGPPIIPPAKTR